MNIDKLGSATLHPTTTPGTGSATDSTCKSRSTAATPSATVQLSPLAVQLSALSATDVSSSNFDAHKVATLKQAVAGGTYRIDAEAVADRLLAEAAAAYRART